MRFPFSFPPPVGLLSSIKELYQVRGIILLGSILHVTASLGLTAVFIHRASVLHDSHSSGRTRPPATLCALTGEPLPVLHHSCQQGLEERDGAEGVWKVTAQRLGKGGVERESSQIKFIPKPDTGYKKFSRMHTHKNPHIYVNHINTNQIYRGENSR